MSHLGYRSSLERRRFLRSGISLMSSSPTQTGNQSNRQNFWGFNPKLGAIYEINRQTQAFVNFSRSWQPPSLDNLVEFTEGPNSSVVYTPLSTATRLDHRGRNSRRVFADSVGVVALSLLAS